MNFGRNPALVNGINLRCCRSGVKEKKMATCGAPSLGDFQGGATFVGRGGQVSTEGAHECALEAGHDGCHLKRSLMPLSPEVAMRTTYLWNDEHELRAEVEIVRIATTTKLADRMPTTVGTR